MGYAGVFELFEDRELENIIEDLGKTEGLATYLAIGAVKRLEYGTWEQVRDFIYGTIVDYVDE